jgi:TonB family protein
MAPTVALVAAAVTAGLFVPPRAARVDSPSLPTGVVWMQASAIAKIDTAGAVADVTIVHGPGPIGPALSSAARGWEFAAALEDAQPVPSSVLVAAIIRPPSFPDIVGFGHTMEGVNRLPDDVAAPIQVQTPPYPPLAVGDGVVVIEIVVDADGAVRSLMIVTPSSGFDSAAEDAARQWKFRPARRNGSAVAGTVLVVFGFVSPGVSAGG